MALSEVFDHRRGARTCQNCVSLILSKEDTSNIVGRSYLTELKRQKKKKIFFKVKFLRLCQQNRHGIWEKAEFVAVYVPTSAVPYTDNLTGTFGGVWEQQDKERRLLG